MGEHKLPKPEPTRPSAALLRIRLAVNSAAGQRLTQEERDFFKDQAAMLAWVDHLETCQPKTEGKS